MAETIATDARPASLIHAMFEVARAAVVLFVADLAVRAVPFDVIARQIERDLRSAQPPALPREAVRRIRWAIGAAHRRLPWIPCLATAIAANRLLARQGVASKLWLGVRPNEQATIAAHAWLEADDCVVTGGSERQSFQPLRALVTSRAVTS